MAILVMYILEEVRIVKIKGRKNLQQKNCIKPFHTNTNKKSKIF